MVGLVLNKPSSSDSVSSEKRPPDFLDVTYVEQMNAHNQFLSTDHVLNYICDRICENQPCTHLVVIRETLV